MHVHLQISVQRRLRSFFPLWQDCLKISTTLYHRNLKGPIKRKKKPVDIDFTSSSFPEVTLLRQCMTWEWCPFKHQRALILRFHIFLFYRRTMYEGVSICNENPFITPSTNALGFYAICQTKDQSVADIMVHETLFHLTKLMSNRLFKKHTNIHCIYFPSNCKD